MRHAIKWAPRRYWLYFGELPRADNETKWLLAIVAGRRLPHECQVVHQREHDVASMKNTQSLLSKRPPTHLPETAVQSSEHERISKRRVK